MTTDRNQQARDQFKQQQDMARMRREFAAALAAGTARVVDRIGQPVLEHDLVLYRPVHDFVYEVAEIKPILDPRVAPGWVEMTLLCRVPVQFQVGPPVMSMIRIGRQQEPDHAQLDEPVQAAPTPQPEIDLRDATIEDLDGPDPEETP